jgi:hypothetical protein
MWEKNFFFENVTFSLYLIDIQAIGQVTLGDVNVTHINVYSDGNMPANQGERKCLHILAYLAEYQRLIYEGIFLIHRFINAWDLRSYVGSFYFHWSSMRVCRMMHIALERHSCLHFSLEWLICITTVKNMNHSSEKCLFALFRPIVHIQWSTPLPFQAFSQAISETMPQPFRQMYFVPVGRKHRTSGRCA